jgi:hypothetical protein
MLCTTQHISMSLSRRLLQNLTAPEKRGQATEKCAETQNAHPPSVVIALVRVKSRPGARRRSIFILTPVTILCKSGLLSREIGFPEVSTEVRLPPVIFCRLCGQALEGILPEGAGGRGNWKARGTTTAMSGTDVCGAGRKKLVRSKRAGRLHGPSSRRRKLW